MRYAWLTAWRGGRMTDDAPRREREIVQRYAGALKAAAAHTAAAKEELSALDIVNRHLRDENDFLRAQAGGIPQLAGGMIARERDEALFSRDSLAAENSALVEAADAIEAERRMLALINHRLQDENVVLQAERKRAMADQWLLKQLNADLQERLQRAVPASASSSTTDSADRSRNQAPQRRQRSS